MRKSPLMLATRAIVWLPIALSPATASEPPAALKTFLEHEGYGGSQLQRRFGNHLFVNTLINGRRTALMIDSGCPPTLIDRASAAKLGLQVQETKKYIGGVTGHAERYGISTLPTLVMGNCTFQNVPVEVAKEEQINFIAKPHLDGLFGAHEMAKFGIIVDCARQMMYVNPKGSSAATNQKLAQFLAGRGFSRVPMHFNPEHHLEVDTALNGHPAKLIVDTGSGFSLISAPVAQASGASMSSRFSYHGEGIGYIKQMTLGNLVVNNAEVAVGNVAKFVGAGLLGEEYLSWNFGIVDLGGMNLYLRPPESAPAKKH
jgi:predicted aspartyl protease